MNKILLYPIFLFLCLLVLATSDSNAGAGSPPANDLGEGNGCSALSKPDVDCTDFFNVTCCFPKAMFCGTMGMKGIKVRSNQSNDADTDEESDGVEACICDAIDSNPNININPGDGSVCDSSIQEERDQFVGSLTIADEPLRGQKYEFCYTFTSFPDSICDQND